ncbi:putative transport [Buchnera aphidicola str. Bp (Baizongia pistaciae)]|uniref:Protein TsgA homolog n=1 Tax=Buchnera aphidicola subsp. Baizongia pistaciae (strain Bp) TaxID=224915 RepID=TSGA_BUCBP|nr:RecName: Full=Protein TsgA homolog [Buchnera aphidicola str. Bp (Baizongia pistaciae)]AAO27183.1 putative transport [Buchnera aphidicola str. Bp (Baizongia pistaciae)]
MINKSNLIGLTCISFLSYALTGALITITGIFLENISKYFNIPITDMGNTFTFLNAGILSSIFISSWITNIINLKTQLIFGFILTIIATLILIFSHNLTYFSISMFMLGIISGITMSIGTYIITNLYTDQTRASMLLLTDSFFSMSGIIFPIITALIISNNMKWYWVYFIIGIIYLIIFLITINTKFPIIYTEISKKRIKTWNFSILCLSISALLYILGQLSFISWMPEYTMKYIHISINQSSKLVSAFWMAYMVGMWIFSFILKFFDLKKTIITLSGISLFLMSLFNIFYDYALLYIIILSLGFFSSAIYTIIITLASQQTPLSSPKTINYILTSGTVGTLLTFIITGPIVQKYGIFSALLVSNILYGIVFFLVIIFATLTKTKPIHD